MPTRREYPDRPLVGVGVVVWRDKDQVLLIRRGQPPGERQWGLPGGAQALGETLFDAAEREVREETGLEVRPIEVVTALDGISRDEEARVRFHYTLVVVAAESHGGEPVAADDALDARWASLDDVGAFVTWDETLRVVMLAAEQRRKRLAREKQS
ncbi:8-oxo-dGTP diphosphatase [Azospirillaceae bacterium]